MYGASVVKPKGPFNGFNLHAKFILLSAVLCAFLVKCSLFDDTSGVTLL